MTGDVRANGGGPDVQDVRRAFALIATNVAIVTAPGPHGCTANVWAEAPDPPVVLVTLRRAAATHEQVIGAGRFGVSVLAEEQVAIAQRFAGPRDLRFVEALTRRGPRGLHLIVGALCAMECSVAARHCFGAYDIVVGAVESVALGDGGRPLLFTDQRFARAQDLEPVA